MSEQLERRFHPEKIEHFIPDVDLNEEARELIALQDDLAEKRKQTIVESWAGSEPRSDPQSMRKWTEQATRELMHLPTEIPTAVHLKPVVDIVDFGPQVKKGNFRPHA